MIEFEAKNKNKKVRIANKEREITFRNVSNYDKAVFQSKLLSGDNVTLNGLQSGDVKINLELLPQKDIYLFIYVVKKIEDFDEWERMSEKEKFEFVKKWIEADSIEFDEVVSVIKNEAGDLV